MICLQLSLTALIQGLKGLRDKKRAHIFTEYTDINPFQQAINIMHHLSNRTYQL